MKFLILILIVPSLAAASYLDPLNNGDYARLGSRGLFFSIGALYEYDGGMFNRTGAKETNGGFGYSGHDLWFPLKLGYNLDKHFSTGLVIPYYIPKHHFDWSNEPTVSEDNKDFANPWVWGKGIFQLNESIIAGPRLGVKLPILAYASDSQNQIYYAPIGDHKALTGDKSPSLDLTILCAVRSNTNCFRLSGQVGFRSNLKHEYGQTYYSSPSVPGKIYTYDVTPASTLYTNIMPGFAWDRNNTFKSYLVLEYWMNITDFKVKEYENDHLFRDISSRDGNILSLGVKQDWNLFPFQTLEVKALYDILAVGPKVEPTPFIVPGYPFVYGYPTGLLPAGTSVSLIYSGIIPF